MRELGVVARIVVAALAVLAFSRCNCGECSCAAPSIYLEVPCAAGLAAPLEATGACEGATISCSSSSCTVEPIHEGTCTLAVLLADGTRREFQTTVSLNTGCCRGYYPHDRLWTIDVPVACLDAGVPLDASCGRSETTAECFVIPPFDDCLCQRCSKAGDMAVVGRMTSARPHCSRACACGFGSTDLIYGCTVDSDCALVRAECCACQSGGGSTAILASHVVEWELGMKDYCATGDAGVGGCPAVFLCQDGREAVCDHERCVAVRAVDAGR